MRLFFPACIAVILACASPLRAVTTVNEITRIQGQGELTLRGLGLVVGLNGTGDTAKDLDMVRPLMEVYKNSGNPVVLDDFKDIKNVALVTVTCTIPETGGRIDDRFDVTVAAPKAKSLVGGMLYLCVLQGPYPDGRPPYALADGQVVVESPASPRTGRVRNGARLIRDIKTGNVGDSFTLVLRPAYAGWASASEIANTITQNIYGKTGSNLAGLPQIATVIDDRSVRIDIPPTERANTAAFVGDVLSTPINVALLKLPAQVIYNEAAGQIVVTGDVEISPVAITQSDLTITTTMPPPTPTADNPLVESRTWAGIAPGAKESDKARLQDLLNAFNQLKIPVKDQIGILEMLEKTGKLHAKLIKE
jgi:flagellar P-ring protein FlgI